MTLIFFHLPKTGGSSIHHMIESCLSDNSNKITISNDNISSIDGSLLPGLDYSKWSGFGKDAHAECIPDIHTAVHSLPLKRLSHYIQEV